MREKLNTDKDFSNNLSLVLILTNDRNLDLRMQSILSIRALKTAGAETRVSKFLGAKGDVPKIYRFVHPLHPC